MKPLTLNCDCLGGKKSCGSLKVLNYGDGDFEFKSTKKEAIYLKPESIKKLIKFMSK